MASGETTTGVTGTRLTSSTLLSVCMLRICSAFIQRLLSREGNDRVRGNDAGFRASSGLMLPCFVRALLIVGVAQLTLLRQTLT